MTFEQLECFFEVAHCRNFSKAAERLFLSQPNLTKYISKLETELGVRLFDRSTHHCQLTEEGQLFFRQTEDLFFQLNSRIEDTKLRSRNLYRMIRIGICPGEHPIPEFMDLVRRRNQTDDTHRFLMLEHSYVDLIDKLISRELDMIVTSDRNARSIEEFAYCRLAPFEMQLAIHKSNPKARNPNLKPSDCADEITFLALPDGKNSPISRIDEFDRNTGGGLSMTVLPSPADLMNNVMVCAGVGVVPKTVNKALYPDVVFFPFEEPKPKAGQFLIWRRNTTNPAAMSLIQTARETLSIPEE